MKKGFSVLGLLTLLLLASCQSSGRRGQLSTAARSTVAVIIVPAREQFYRDIDSLNSTPQEFNNSYIQVSGLYSPLPELYCGQGARSSPTGFALSDGDSSILAGGPFDELLRHFADDELALTVQGRWQYWQGDVGCGKAARPEAFWYLAVEEIVAPNPITRQLSAVSAIPVSTPETSDATAVAEQPPPAATSEALATLAPTLPSTLTAEPSPTILILPTAVFTATEPPVVSTEVTLTAIPSPITATVIPTLEGKPTEEGTGEPTSTPTATVAGTASPNPQETATSAVGDVVIQGLLPPLSLALSAFEGPEQHAWQFEVSSSTTVSMSVVPAFGADINLAIVDPAGTVIANRNEATAGQPESIASLSLATPGIYDILIEQVSGPPSSYALLYNHPDFVFQESLISGMTRQGALEEDVDHLWHFDAQAGEVVTIHVVPDGLANIYLELWGPDEDRTVIARDSSSDGDGVTREFVDLELPETGFYAIHIGEFNFLAATFTVTLTSIP